MKSTTLTQNVLPTKGIRLKFEKSSRDYVPGFYGNLYVLALMDLFGLYKVEHFSRPVTPWKPAQVERCPFGNAVLALLRPASLDLLFPGDPSEDEDEESDEPTMELPRFGAWQPLFQPYFPEWKRNLELPRPEHREGEFIFRVAVGKVW
jgi:hypothetical protein